MAGGRPDTALRLRRFGPPGILAMLVVLGGSFAGPVVGALLVFVWAHASRTPLQALGFVRPRSWALTVAGGAAFGIALKLVMKAIVMPLLHAPAINAAYGHLAGNTAALPAMVATVLVSAGFGEEVLFRGFLFERFGALLGSGRTAIAGTILLSAALFAIAHFQGQGVPGVQQAAIFGMVFGGIFAWMKRIWFLMIAHAAFDLTAVAIIYWRLEETVAHLLFG